jgi:LysR family transcriptional regulator (chromosome initiation inhibitor)
LVEECRLVDLAPDHPIDVQLFWHHWEHQPSLSIDVTRHVLNKAAQLLQ